MSLMANVVSMTACQLTFKNADGGYRTLTRTSTNISPKYGVMLLYCQKHHHVVSAFGCNNLIRSRASDMHAMLSGSRLLPGEVL